MSQAIGVLAFVLNVWGNLALTKQSNHGHVIRLCSNACWLIYSPLVGAWALMLNHATFAGINLLGFHRWKKIDKARMKACEPGRCYRINCCFCKDIVKQCNCHRGDKPQENVGVCGTCIKQLPIAMPIPGDGIPR